MNLACATKCQLLGCKMPEFVYSLLEVPRRFPQTVSVVYVYVYVYVHTHTYIYIYTHMHAKLYIHNLCISCAWRFISHGFVTKVASSCTGMHKVHFAGGLLIYLLAVPYAQSACCILRLQRSSRSHQVADFLFFLANAWHIGCRGVFWTE